MKYILEIKYYNLKSGHTSIDLVYCPSIDEYNKLKNQLENDEVTVTLYEIDEYNKLKNILVKCRNLLQNYEQLKYTDVQEMIEQININLNNE